RSDRPGPGQPRGGGDRPGHPGADHRGPLRRLRSGNENSPRSDLKTNSSPFWEEANSSPLWGSTGRRPGMGLPEGLTVLVCFPEPASLFAVTAGRHLAPAAGLVLRAVVKSPSARI